MEALGYGRRVESGRVFFIEHAFEHQEAVGGDAQSGVMMEAAPVAAFVEREAEFGLELLLVALDQPPPHGIEDELPEGSLAAQRR